MRRYLLLGVIVLPLLILAAIFRGSKILIHLGTAELVLIGIVVNLFVIVYSRRRWTANPYGRALMYSKLSLALLVNLSVYSVVFGIPDEWRGFVRIIIFGVILFAQARLFHLLFSAKNKVARLAFEKEAQEMVDKQK